MKGKGKIAIVVSALILLLAGVVYFRRDTGLKLETTAVSLQAAEDFYEEDGVVNTQELKQLTSKVGGSVLEVHVAKNQRIHKGDIIAQLDTADLMLQKAILESAQAELTAKKDESDISRLMMTAPGEYMQNLKSSLDAARMAYDTAQKEYAAKEALFQSGDLSQIELDAGRASLESTKSSFEAARNRYNESNDYLDELKGSGKTEEQINQDFYASVTRQIEANLDAGNRRIEQLQKQIEDCTIRSDTDGVITELPVSTMNIIGMGAIIAVINADTSALTAECDVLTDIAPFLEIGDAVELSFTFRGKEIKERGEIREIYDFASEGISALGLKEYRVKVIVDILGNTEQTEEIGLADIHDGYSVKCRFKLYENPSCIVLPIGAVYEEDGKKMCFKVTDGIAEKQEIQTEYISSTFVVASEGIAVGERIINSADHEDLKEGIRIQISH